MLIVGTVGDVAVDFVAAAAAAAAAVVVVVASSSSQVVSSVGGWEGVVDGLFLLGTEFQG